MKAEKILKLTLEENGYDKFFIKKSGIVDVIVESMERYSEINLEQKQSEIDELVEFISRQISEGNFINECDRFEAIDLINKQTHE